MKKTLLIALHFDADQLQKFLTNADSNPRIMVDISLAPSAPKGGSPPPEKKERRAYKKADRPKIKSGGQPQRAARAFEPLTADKIREKIAENVRKCGKERGSHHAALLACQDILRHLNNNADRYTDDKETSKLYDTIVEEASKVFPVFSDFRRANQSAKDMVCDWMERFVTWLTDGGKGDPPRYFLPPKLTEDAMRERLDRAGDDLDGLENSGKRIVGHLKADTRFTDAERQELMTCLKDLFVSRVTLACGGHVSGAEADRMANAIFGTRPRQRSPRGQRPRPESGSDRASDNDAPSDGPHEEPPEAPVALPRHDKKPPPASEKDKAARRRADKERAEAKRAQREARREQMEARRRDPNYGEMKSPICHKEKNKGKKSKDRRADNDTAQAA